MSKETLLFYREIAPSLATLPVIAAFWEFTASGEKEAVITHEVFPDGCVSLFYYRNRKQKESGLLISQLSLESAQIPIRVNDVYWGLRISPAACRAFLRVAPQTLQTMPARYLPAITNFAEQLEAELDTCPNFSAAIDVFEKFVQRIEFETIEIDERIFLALKLIEENKAQVKVAALAAQINLSVRQFERLFLRAAGLTPKQYIRARRIRQTAINLVNDNQSNWAERAAEIGFTDQAHLTHELVAVTKQSPVVFAQNIQRIKHGLLVK